MHGETERTKTQSNKLLKMAQICLTSTDSLFVSRSRSDLHDTEIQKFEVPLGRYYTPIICPQDDLCFSEPEGRNFHIPTSFLGTDKKFTEGERVPFHYLYCVTGVDWLVWHQENAKESENTKRQKLRELLQQNYDSLISQEEKEKRASLLEDSLSLQRENNPLVDSFKLTDRYNILMRFAELIGNDELYETAGHCWGKSVVGFTPKDFRILLDVEGIPTKEKCAILKALFSLRDGELVMN
ncbi:conserved hypothetical protein [Lausannevirus]|uniref:Uncharacterized protein n=1 Tax=Lausannevirus TaxID=999883 RepID=F2WLW9_9VIRU|nr:hypothetical protein LAU_0392 [Lausannevirus]AEA07242.1 conserved hypothetical protein [Lausannevirus]